MPPKETAQQNLPTEVIGIIGSYLDLETHNALRATCSSVRLYVPAFIVVGFKKYKKLYFRHIRYSRNIEYHVYLDIHHKALTMEQVVFLYNNKVYYELCRIARKVIDNPEAYNGIDLLYEDCYLLTAAADVDDLQLLTRLLQVPQMDPAAGDNRALLRAASLGRLEIVQFLLRDPRVDPSDCSNGIITLASCMGHFAVVQALLQDPRVDPSVRDNFAIGWASLMGHLGVVQVLIKDPRVDPADRDNEAIRWASEHGRLAVVQELMKDPRVDPSSQDNYAIRLASRNNHLAVVQALLQNLKVLRKVMSILKK